MELSSGLDLAGHELQIFGGYAGSVALRSPVGAGTFSLIGPGPLAFDWKESLLDEENADWDKLSMSVTTGAIAIPEDVTVAVAGLG